MTIRIYLITNLVNGKKYVGQTVKPISLRWRRHCWSCTLKTNRMAISGAILKYGRDKFSITEIDSATTLEEGNRKEVYWANYHDCFSPKGYNLKAGGRKYVFVSEETRKKIGLANLGRVATQETRENLSKSHLGFRLTQETKDKLSIVKKGKPAHPRVAAAASLKNAKKYLLSSPNGEQVSITNMRAFCRENKLQTSKMSGLVQGKVSAYRGWRLLKDLGYLREKLGSRRNPRQPS